MFLALHDGVNVVAEKYDIPKGTIQRWFSSAGGLTRMRAFLEEETRSDYLRFVRAIFARGVERANQLNDEQLFLTLRKLIDSYTMSGQSQQAVAGAQANVSIVLKESEDVP